MNLTENIYTIATETPNRKLFVDRNNLTYGEFCNIVDGYAAYFCHKGIKAGTRCIVLIAPSVNMFAVSFALFRMGAIPVMIDSGMGVGPMVKALDMSEAEFVIAMPGAMLIKVLFPHKLKTVQRWVTVCNKHNGKVGIAPFHKLKKTCGYPIYEPTPDDLSAIFFTSGSTGAAKGVIYRQSQLESQLKILKEQFHYTHGERDLCTFPLIGFFAISLGLSVALARMDMTNPATLNPKRIIRDLDKNECTLMFCSPMVLRKLTLFVEIKDIHIKSLRHLHLAGAAVDPDLVKRFKKHLHNKAQINTPYGATEALPVTTINDKELAITSQSSIGNGVCVGKPIKGIEIKIIPVDDNPIININKTRELKHNEVGEVMVLGDNVTQEYLANSKAEEFSKVFDNETGKFWHRMGDLGYRDENNFIWIVGRKNHRVETYDRTFYTLPVEQIFNKHIDVERSALVSVIINNKTIPVICCELKRRHRSKQKIKEELVKLAGDYTVTKGLSAILFHKHLPVDPRHNAKIFREKLTVWAQQKAKRYW